MNSRIKAGLLGASLFGIATSGQAQNRAEAFTLTPYVGGYLFDSKQDLESAPIFGIRAGYNFTEHVGAELFGSYVLTESDRRSGPETNVESDVYRFGGNLLYHFLPKQKFVPFAAIGFGRYNVTVPDLNRPKTNKSLAEYGGGFKYFVADDFALRADIRHVLATLDEREQQVIRLRFGLDDGQPRTLDQIGKLFGLSRERVRQIEREVMTKLRQGERADRLRSYAS